MLQRNDLLLISHLRDNARETLTRMSKKTSIPISTIFERLKSYNEHLIRKHTALVDFGKLGYHAIALLFIRVRKDKREQIREYLLKHQNVNSAFKVNNGYDYFVEAIFANINELEAFIDCLEEKFPIKSKQVYYILEDIKREDFLSDPAKLEIITA
ncbi:MAG: Lrp/AsnC family transcriptional regulator [archaeon]